MKTIERLENSFHFNCASRFVVLYGIGIEDTFISKDYSELTIENALVTALKEQGVSRIAFIAPHKPVYFKDSHSEANSSSIKLVSEPKPHYQSGQMQTLSGGPLSNRFLYRTPQATKESSGFSGMGDIHSIRYLDSLIREINAEKTAIVVLQAESFFRFFGDNRMLSGIVGEWARLPASNPNRVIFVFSANRYDQLCQIAQQIPLPELRKQILQRENSNPHHEVIVNLSGPDHLEILRLIRKIQQDRKIRIIEKDVLRLSQWMAIEGKTINQWMTELAPLTTVDLETARKSGWFSSHTDPNRSASEKINALIGLDPIKNRIKELSQWIQYRESFTEDSVEPSESTSHHMVFSGNPGTGKTTIARLIGELFREIGLLKRGHLVEVHTNDLVAEYVGNTSIKTNQVIDQALDGVLFIDEAYMLSSPDRGGFGQEAIDTLVSRLENDRHRLVVIVAGYPDRMEKFLNANPGLKRRFPRENVFHFPDYSPEQLWLILQQKLTSSGIPFDDKISLDLQHIIEEQYRNRDETFGNAGEIRNLKQGLERARAVRIIEENLNSQAPLSIEDIPANYRTYLQGEQSGEESFRDELNALVGLASVKKILMDQYSRLQYDQLRRKIEPTYLPTQPLQHLIFSGNPGTGKTTIARLVGKMYRELGLLKKGHCIEVTRADLVAGYVGQSMLKTQEVVKSALDGVLFIDEAYTLSQGSDNDFGKESIDFLSHAAEINRFRLLIIAAGYPDEMLTFLSKNPGLASRFAPPIPFLDFSLQELNEILDQLVRQNGFILPEECHDLVVRSIKSLIQTQGAHFGNARAIHQLFEEMKINLARRIIASHSSSNPISLLEMVTFLPEDVPLNEFSGLGGLIDLQTNSSNQIGQEKFKKAFAGFKKDFLNT